MRVPMWITCGWPGLPRVWAYGDAAGLIWAVGFAALLNAAVITTFVWPELVSPAVQSALWWGLAGLWLAATTLAVRQFRLAANRPQVDDDAEALFVQAQQECLQGDWYPAEATLRRLLRVNADDADGRLMLATVLRHTGRTKEARRELKRLEQLESADKWRLEIQQEYERVDALTADPEASAATDDVDVVEPPADDSPTTASELPRTTENSEAA